MIIKVINGTLPSELCNLKLVYEQHVNNTVLLGWILLNTKTCEVLTSILASSYAFLQDISSSSKVLFLASSLWIWNYNAEKILHSNHKEIITELNQNFKIYIYVWVDYLIWLYSLFPVNDFNMVHGTCIIKVHNKVLSHVIIINRNVIKVLAPG